MNKTLDADAPVIRHRQVYLKGDGCDLVERIAKREGRSFNKVALRALQLYEGLYQCGVLDGVIRACDKESGRSILGERKR